MRLWIFYSFIYFYKHKKLFISIVEVVLVEKSCILRLYLLSVWLVLPPIIYWVMKVYRPMVDEKLSLDSDQKSSRILVFRGSLQSSQKSICHIDILMRYKTKRKQHFKTLAFKATTIEEWMPNVLFQSMCYKCWCLIFCFCRYSDQFIYLLKITVHENLFSKVGT